MAAITESARSQVEYLTGDGARKLFDEVARRNLGVSGEEFIRRWNDGEYAARREQPEVVRVAMLQNLGRAENRG